MRRWIVLLLNAILAANVLAADELPTHAGEEGFAIEPPLLIQSRSADGSPVIAGVAPDIDVTQAEADLARARRRAAGAQGLYKAGIIAKVEAEERALKVIRLEAKVAEARLQAAKRRVEGEQPNETMAASTNAGYNPELAQAAAAAERADADRRRAELEAAFRNLARQQKLLALGSGRRADVNRAQEKLAALQHSE